MRWEDFRSSDNVEDRRGEGGGFRLPGGGGGRGLGLGTIVVLGLVGWALGIDPRILIGGAEMISGGGGPAFQQEAPRRSGPSAPPTDEMGRFAAAILGNTEDVWNRILPEQINRQYRNPRLVLFTGQSNSGCGFAQSAMGPFYCPLDETVYIDLTFFQEMRTRFGASGDFAYAYVIAHEVGHHVENVMGILPRVQEIQRRVDRREANQLSVKVELMADCLAGVWAFHSNQRWKSLEEGDVEEAMNAASAIGDDKLQKQAQGRVLPDSFTHGSSAQRVRWFMTGMKGGDVRRCDTFRAEQL